MQCFHQLVSTLFTELRALSSLLLSHNSDRLGKLQDQGYACLCLLSTEITSVLCHALHFMWSWALNFSSHACMASIVLTGPSPQPIAHSLLRNGSLYYSVLEWLWPRTSGIQSLVKNFPKACMGICINMNWNILIPVFSDLIPRKLLIYPKESIYYCMFRQKSFSQKYVFIFFYQPTH